MITKSERTELSAIARRQFKVLRAEVGQREFELYAEIESQINTEYAEESKKWNDAVFLAKEKVREANRAVNDVFRDVAGVDYFEATERELVALNFHGVNLRQQELRAISTKHEARAHIQAKVKAAVVALDRQEVDLLRDLSIGALESEEAKQFLRMIPTVSELVPTVRLAELEAQFGHD